jgi:predicted ABC-type ATPase
MDKRILSLAGPNGAGKTTFAREFLVREVSCPAFLNADLIAAGLSPFDPGRAALRAGRLMLELIAEHVARVRASPSRPRSPAGTSRAQSSSGVRRATTFR